MDRLEQFCEVYRRLNRDNLELLSSIYDREIRFRDPAHTLNGLEQLQGYFAGLYCNAEEVSFVFTNHLEAAEQAFVEWTMTLRHPRLERGRQIEVDGASSLRFNRDGLVDRHRDYFDLGALLYEHLPLLGRVITTLKRRLGT